MSGRFMNRRFNSLHRVVWQALAVMLAVGFFGAGTAQARKKKKTAPPPPPTAVAILKEARQLPGVMLEDAEPITGKIQKIALDHLQEWMANKIPSDVEVRRELESMFSLLHWPIFGKPAVFDEPWKGGVVIGAGYTLGWTDYDRANVVALFDCREGKSRLAAVTNFVPRTDLNYEFLPPQGWDDFRFFVYGFRLGKSQLRLSAILYSFDGQNLKSLWETHDAYDGKLDVQGDKVVLRYLKEDEYVREQVYGRKPPRHESIFKVTAQGLELETEHEIPF